MRDVHVSGYADASDDEWAALFKFTALHADVFGVTERPPVKPMRWRSTHPTTRGEECRVIWNPAVWRIAAHDGDCEGARLLTDKTFFTGKGHERPGVTASWVLLARQTDSVTFLRLVAHMPASVQRGDGFSTNARRVLAWRDALRGLVRAMNELRADLRPDEVVVSADWNVDLRRRFWRRYLNRRLRRCGLRLHPPTEGTHHDRAIDAHASTMRAREVRVLDRRRGFDHRPVFVDLDRK